MNSDAAARRPHAAHPSPSTPQSPAPLPCAVTHRHPYPQHTTARHYIPTPHSDGQIGEGSDPGILTSDLRVSAVDLTVTVRHSRSRR